MERSYPVLQVALDTLDLNHVKDVVQASKQASFPDQIWIEAGTPLIKKHGTQTTLKTIREVRPDAVVIADMKTLDVGWLEVRFAAEDGANIVAVSGLANNGCIEGAIKEAKEHRIQIMCDMMNVRDPVARLRSLVTPPDLALLHRGIDAEESTDRAWHHIAAIKEAFPNLKVAVAGGINPETGKQAIELGADVIIVGRAVTTAESYATAFDAFAFVTETRE